MIDDDGVKVRIQAEFNVSFDTMDRLSVHAALLKKWNPAINLVAKSTLNDLWTRHFLDSAQVFGVARLLSGRWLDLGTGGGFPGMVVAILAAELAPKMTFTFIESDARKAVFLQNVSRETGVLVDVLTQRAEKAPPQAVDVVSARAMAPLRDLLPLAQRHLKPAGIGVFQKGATHRQEMKEALETWRFQSDEYASTTDANAVILKFGDIRLV